MNIHTLITAVNDLAAYENATRYGGKPQLEIEARKLQRYECQGQLKIDWHSGIPNDVCAFSFSYDENHCAAYIYVLEQPDELKCTLRVSNQDAAHYATLPCIPKSLAPEANARSIVDTLIAATEGLKSRGSIEQFVRPARGLLASQLNWYSDGGL